MPAPRRSILAIAALLLIAAGLFLFWHHGERSAKHDAHPAGGSAGARHEQDHALAGGDRGAARGTGSGPRAGHAGDDVEVGPDGTRTYVTDTGRLVRDHTGDTDPNLFPAPMKPEDRTMSSSLVADVYRKLASVVATCSHDVPAGDRGKEPLVYVTLTVNVAGGNLTTTDVNADTSDVADASRDQVSSCVRAKAASIQVPSGSEPDRTGYVVQFPLRIR